MTEAILHILALAPGPQTTSEILDSLRREGLRTEEFQVAQQLRDLQKQSLVRLDGTRWRLLNAPQENRSGPLGVSAVGSGSSPQPLPILRFRPSEGSLSVPQPVGRWALFRRLCRYYMDCLLQDEAPQLRAYVENEDDTWIAVQEVPWTRLAAEGGFAVSLSREQAPFQRNRVRRGAEECIYLGYPLILVKPRESSRFVVPLFAQPMQAEWSGGVLHLQPDGPIAVNGAWLEFHFRQRTEREEFLRAIGLLTDLNDEFDESEATAVGPKDFSRLAVDAGHYIHTPDRFAQQVEPFSLTRVPDWSKAQPGLYNSAVLTLGPRLRYTRSLLRDLRDISEKFSDEDLDETALGALFPHDPSASPTPSAQPSAGTTPSASTLAQEGAARPETSEAAKNTDIFSRDLLVQTRLLHPSQRAAVMNALAEPASVVTGPPGTGKSEVVASMLMNQLLRGRPTLFASKNHQALEAVIPRLNGGIEGGELIIQTSSRELAQRQSYLGKLQSLLAKPPRPDAAQGDAFLKLFSELFIRQHRALEEIQTLTLAREEYCSLTQQLAEKRKQLPLAAQSDEAIAAWPKDLTSAQLDALEATFVSALAVPKTFLGRLWQKLRPSYFEEQRRVARAPLMSVASPFPDRPLPSPLEPASAWGDFFSCWKNCAEAARLTSLIRNCEQRLAQMPPQESSTCQLAEVQESLEGMTRDWMGWAAGGLPNPLTPVDREALANLRAGIQTWGPDRFGRELRKHFPLILRAFPLWSVSNLSARSALPLVPGLFELVLIDEASQCDIASVIPLLARSRRAVMVGDPMQLRHVSNLDVTVDQTLLQQYNLTETAVQRFTYRVNSAFDLAEANPSIPNNARTRLDLHFRSHAHIAEYCNEAFYSKTLHVVTVTERLRIPRGTRAGIYWTHVVGQLSPGQTGSWCLEEIEAIKSELLRLAEAGYTGTVGVVTPFRQQMIRLKDALETAGALPREFIERTDLHIDTAYGFQGGERDLILFSLCGGPDLTPGGVWFFREERNQFNVAVSRARAVLHIVGNRDWALASGCPHLERLASRTLPGWSIATGSKREAQSPWQLKLAETLKASGVSTVLEYPVAGRFLDLAVLGSTKLDIEVDGESVHRTAKGGRKDDDYWRDLQLQSLGWKVRRFWVYELREKMEECVAKIMIDLNEAVSKP